MSWKRSKEHHMKNRNRQPFWILFFMILIAVTGIYGSRMVLLKNANYMGKNLVQSYALDEERSIGIYENMVGIGMSYIKDQAAEGTSQEKMEEWILSYFQKTKDSMHSNVANSYAVVDGKIIAKKDWEGIESYDYASTSWYRQAMEAKGDVIFTDAYQDFVYKHSVITIAAADPDTGNAVAFDLLPENFQQNHKNLQLLENSSYYVCDSVGEVLYQRSSFDVSEKTVLKYAKNLYKKVDSGEIDNVNSTITDLDGKKRGVYFYRAPNGWLCILTIPFETLYQNLYGVYLLYGIILIILFVIMVLVWIRDQRWRKYIANNDDTIKLLGNSYYAIYRIKLGDGTYEMTKGSEYVRERLPYSGRYEELLHVLIGCMDEETRQDFAKSFSLNNIYTLAREKIMDFGGDFLRLFGDEYKWVNVRLVQDPENSPGEAVLCFRKVEEEKQRQLQQVRLLEDALQSADASAKSQKQFFFNMSHDMRTPLNVIIGMAELGKRNQCTYEQLIDYFNKIRVAGKQLLALFDDILEMSRIEQGKIDLENTTFHLCDTLKKCVSPFEMKAREEGKKFKVKMDVSSPMVCGDSSRLTQILNNLISNAVKFTERGDCITVILNQVKKGKHGRYVFVIEDTGAGMSEEFLSRLFEPYEREKRFGVKNVIGTGLGMSIVKNLVSRMGGEIAVDSKLGKGTRFIVTLPFPESCSEPDLETEKEELDFHELEGKRVLLAEDNQLNREIVTEILGMKGMEVYAVENGREAVEKFSESEISYYDVVLMDMQMPEMDGCEAARKIRALERTDAKITPIVALTANAFPEDIARTAGAGMNAHLSKPIDPQTLWAALKQYILQKKDR